MDTATALDSVQTAMAYAPGLLLAMILIHFWQYWTTGVIPTCGPGESATITASCLYWVPRLPAAFTAMPWLTGVCVGSIAALVICVTVLVYLDTRKKTVAVTTVSGPTTSGTVTTVTDPAPEALPDPDGSPDSLLNKEAA